MSPEIEAADAMRACGITPPDQISFDGKIRRFGPKKSCWCVFFNGAIQAGAFGDWKRGIKEKYIESNQAITALDRKRIGRAMRDAAALRERELKIEHERASRDCAITWGAASNE